MSTKVYVFAWRLLRNRVPTKMNLLRRGILQPTMLHMWGVVAV